MPPRFKFPVKEKELSEIWEISELSRKVKADVPRILELISSHESKAEGGKRKQERVKVNAGRSTPAVPPFDALTPIEQL